ncbi:hypothetical protein O6H91_08G088500 [Diphasiastrum complanatum]|uniref:Uncharacterized protein n=1 Tax=Diphasiastrum complanatum TaxID=34168 RepID=A0ACC2CZS0_DIPCM|nr:hypothetical protein O6H91_08G088500 [Diphasiastrum complanatum]
MAFSSRGCSMPNCYYLRPALINWLFVILTIVSSCNADSSSSTNQTVTVIINGGSTIAKVDANFLCATLDWWPPEKCDYGTCSWGNASLLNLDLTNQLLQTAVRGLSPIMLRLGGTLQDKLVYQLGNIQSPCLPFVKQSALFGFSDGCLPMSRWDALNKFFQKTGVLIAFGLNALYGRETNTSQRWDSSNARDFINYTASKGYPIQAWELGNELSGSGVGTSIPVSQYATDMKTLRAIVDTIYSGWGNKPLVVAPDGFFDANWFQQLLQRTGSKVVDVLTFHIYNLGPGVSTDLVDKILNPSYLSQAAGTFQSTKQILQNSGPWAQAWVGEAGGAYNSGHHLVTDAFVFGFWYLDQLGTAAKYDTKVYCRQSLIGGNYGLLDHTTFQPNPDYYSALLWKQLMGPDVLSASVNGTSYLRAYAHCSKGDSQSITVLLLNLSNSTQYIVKISFSDVTLRGVNLNSNSQSSSKAASAGAAGKMDKATNTSANTQRLEYHLTAPKGNLNSQEVQLNGIILQINADGNLPVLKPATVDASELLIVAPTSIVFLQLPGISLPACTQAASS